VRSAPRCQPPPSDRSLLRLNTIGVEGNLTERRAKVCEVLGYSSEKGYLPLEAEGFHEFVGVLLSAQRSPCDVIASGRTIDPLEVLRSAGLVDPDSVTITLSAAGLARMLEFLAAEVEITVREEIIRALRVALPRLESYWLDRFPPGDLDSVVRAILSAGHLGLSGGVQLPNDAIVAVLTRADDASNVRERYSRDPFVRRGVELSWAQVMDASLVLVARRILEIERSDAWGSRDYFRRPGFWSFGGPSDAG
jgi:hypothetical protein